MHRGWPQRSTNVTLSHDENLHIARLNSMFPLIAGMTFIALSIALAYRNWRRRKTWCVAQASTQILGTEKTKWMNEAPDTHERIRFRFTDQHGRGHSVDVLDHPGLRTPEQSVPVFYDPDNPKKTMIGTTRDMYAGASILAVIGALGLIFAGFIFFG